jgi:hypothetical protein
LCEAAWAKVDISEMSWEAVHVVCHLNREPMRGRVFWQLEIQGHLLIKKCKYGLDSIWGLLLEVVAAGKITIGGEELKNSGCLFSEYTTAMFAEWR